MKQLRGLLLVLILANMVLFAWTRDWFGSVWPSPSNHQREPQRLAAQVRPERLALLAPVALATTPAPASVPAPGAAAVPSGNERLCLESSPLSGSQIAAVNAALVRLGVDVAQFTQRPLGSAAWMVFAGRFTDTDARLTRLQSWLRQGVPQPEMMETPFELAPGLVFSRHSSRAEADAALSQLAAAHPAVLPLARVAQLPENAPGLAQLRVQSAAPALAQLLRDASLVQQQARFAACVQP